MIELICLHSNIAIVSTPLRDEFNKFPDIFVLAFKIVVNSWKFTMLLLYILWDDWPIFIISGSNEQLQQELEYTLLKQDCHSWWISKMQFDTLEEQYAINFCFKLGKNAKETYGKFQTAFRPSSTRSKKKTSMGVSRSCWNGTTSALQPEEITSKGTRVSCVYYQ